MPSFRLTEKHIPLLFVIITILAYGLLVPFTGFYWDDWPFSWLARFLGPAEFLPAFIGIRPFLIPIFFVTTSLVPPVPIYWQIFALVIRVIAGLSAWFALKNVWPRFKFQTLIASLLFLVFPAYSQHWVAYTHINQEWIAFILYLLSMGLTFRAIRNPHKSKAYTVYALLLMFEGLFATEYTLGMEPLRFLFIWVILSEEITDLKRSFLKALRTWLPYLGIWLLNGVWLAWYYSRGYNAYDVEIINKSHTNFFLVFGEAVWKAGLYAWAQVLVLVSKAITSPSSILTVALIGLSFIILFLIIKKFSDSQPITRTTYLQFILIGLIGLILGRVPSLAAGLPFRLQSSFDRFAISMMLGGSLFILGLVEWLVKNPRLKVYTFVLLISLGVGQQFFNGNIFRRDWERQQEIFWQMKWRMPSLEPNTLLLSNEIAVDYESDISLMGPINWIYEPDYKRGNLHYLLLYPKNRLGGTLPSLEPNTKVEFKLRTETYYGNTSQAVVFYMPENGCLRVLDPQLGDQETYNNVLGEITKVVPLSDTSLIHGDELEPAEFLAKPDISWCYYYTKAELARQFKDWDQILSLEKEAKQNGFETDDPFDQLPFIEANAMKGNFDAAKKLSTRAIKDNAQVRVGVCKVWERVQAEGPEGDEAKTNVSGALHEFQCTK
ncbi:MAG: hypothetical protein IPP66_00315 [Anaerolineales bacterium]|nr:hypothetical protein [Anaerolineales bacterium]